MASRLRLDGGHGDDGSQALLQPSCQSIQCCCHRIPCPCASPPLASHRGDGRGGEAAGGRGDAVPMTSAARRAGDDGSMTGHSSSHVPVHVALLRILGFTATLEEGRIEAHLAAAHDPELLPSRSSRRVAPASVPPTVLRGSAPSKQKELCKLHAKLEQQRSSLLETIANLKKVPFKLSIAFEIT